MKQRLEWIAGELAKLHGNGWVRYEGDTVYFGLKMELDSVIAAYQEPVAAAPVIEQVVMTEEQVSNVVAKIIYHMPPALQADEIIGGVHAALEASDVAVMAAINAKGDDVIAELAALKPAA